LIGPNADPDLSPDFDVDLELDFSDAAVNGAGVECFRGFGTVSATAAQWLVISRLPTPQRERRGIRGERTGLRYCAATTGWTA